MTFDIEPAWTIAHGLGQAFRRQGVAPGRDGEISDKALRKVRAIEA